MLYVEKFLCCFELETGGLVIGLMNIFSCAFLAAIFMVYGLSFILSNALPHGITLIILSIWLLIFVKLGFDFIKGIQEVNHYKMKIFRFVIIASFVLCALSFFTVMLSPELLEQKLRNGKGYFSMIVTFMTSAYEFIVVESVYQKIQKNNVVLAV